MATEQQNPRRSYVSVFVSDRSFSGRVFTVFRGFVRLRKVDEPQYENTGPNCFKRSYPSINKRRRFRATLFSLATAVLFFGFVLIAKESNLRINVSPSIPVGIWKATDIDTELSRGDSVGVCLQRPDDPRHVRPDLATFTCGADASSFKMFKYVLAVPGDRVSVSASGMTVNKILIPYSQPKVSIYDMAVDLNGVVPDGQYLLGASHPDSFDSRYLGYIANSEIVERIEPLLTIEG